jgi:hypothetical protein
MPVGNSDRGVGLWAGQVMFGVDNANQYIDWWHAALDGPGEGFDHEGSLTSFILTPSFTIGLSNYWNMSITQIVGKRVMNWKGSNKTIHHRDEGSESSFSNALGGFLGDTKTMFRYLVLNDGMGDGKRLFLGGGLVIPSKNTLTSDPFFLNGDNKTDHRHFSMSQGVYKGVFEIQFFKKQMINPVFMGGAIAIETPLKENKWGYQGSSVYDVSLTAFSKKITLVNAAIGASAVINHNTASYWNGFKTPHSQSTMVTVGGGMLWNLSFGSISLNIQKPSFVAGGFSGIGAPKEQQDLKQRVSAWQLSVGYRKMLDFVIPWLDPLKNL